jgi:hypothetical protein
VSRVSGLRPQVSGVDLPADEILPMNLSSRVSCGMRLSTGHLFVTTISHAFGFSLCGPCCLPGLTAYLLNVKVFVWFHPSILVTGTQPLPRASSGSGVCVPFLVSPHEIGKLEELRELELPCVGRRIGET